MESKNKKAEKVKWTSSMEVFVIDNFHERRMLWDVHHPYYFKKGIKKMHMEDIVVKLKEVWPQETKGLKPDTVRQKFANIRTYYFRELKKKRANPSYHSKWEHFERMHFMCKAPETPGSQVHHSTNSHASEAADSDAASTDEEDESDPLNVALRALQEAREDPQDRAYWFVNFLKCEIRSFPEADQNELINQLLSTLMLYKERHQRTNNLHLAT